MVSVASRSKTYAKTDMAGRVEHDVELLRRGSCDIDHPETSVQGCHMHSSAAKLHHI